jgi:hypothetical protein
MTTVSNWQIWKNVRVIIKQKPHYVVDGIAFFSRPKKAKEILRT